ncbi:divalent-cation tolerance protein CutA [soil metagenome]
MRLARTLLEERAIACANLLPALTALFYWEGEVREESETLLLLKAPMAQAERVEQRLAELHPYDVPEIARLEAAVNHPYARWMDEVTSGPLRRRTLLRRNEETQR